MTRYKGPERRKLLHLRKTIDEAPNVQKSVLKSMARIIGPDKLVKLDKKLDRVSEVLRGIVEDKNKSVNIQTTEVSSEEELTFKNLKLSERPRNALFNAGIKTIDELMSKTEHDISRIRGIGSKSVREIINALANRGLSLCTITSQEALSIPISSLNFSIRTTNCLESLDVKTIEDLVTKTQVDILKTKMAGRRMLQEIKEVLARFGLTLGFEIPNKFRST
jgi:DNA-directed RNA polymerase alpha subunit